MLNATFGPVISSSTIYIWNIFQAEKLKAALVFFAEQMTKMAVEGVSLIKINCCKYECNFGDT